MGQPAEPGQRRGGESVRPAECIGVVAPGDQWGAVAVAGERHDAAGCERNGVRRRVVGRWAGEAEGRHGHNDEIGSGGAQFREIDPDRSQFKWLTVRHNQVDRQVLNPAHHLGTCARLKGDSTQKRRLLRRCEFERPWIIGWFEAGDMRSVPVQKPCGHGRGHTPAKFEHPDVSEYRIVPHRGRSFAQPDRAKRADA